VNFVHFVMYPVSCLVDVQMAQAKQDGTTHVVFSIFLCTVTLSYLNVLSS